jgi:hypothetical protein
MFGKCSLFKRRPLVLLALDYLDQLSCNNNQDIPVGLMGRKRCMSVRECLTTLHLLDSPYRYVYAVPFEPRNSNHSTTRSISHPKAHGIFHSNRQEYGTFFENAVALESQ